MGRRIELPSTEIMNDEFILHNYINLKGKMVLNKAEAALLMLDLWNYLEQPDKILQQKNK